MFPKLWGPTVAAVLASPAHALNILVTNDDCPTSNVKALQEALKADGHDVIVSVPCTGQSRRSGATALPETRQIEYAQDTIFTQRTGGDFEVWALKQSQCVRIANMCNIQQRHLNTDV